MKKVTLNDIKELLESRISKDEITSLKEIPAPIHFKDIEKAIALLQAKTIIKELNITAQKHQLDFKNENHELFGIY